MAKKRCLEASLPSGECRSLPHLDMSRSSGEPRGWGGEAVDREPRGWGGASRRWQRGGCAGGTCSLIPVPQPPHAAHRRDRNVTQTGRSQCDIRGGGNFSGVVVVVCSGGEAWLSASHMPARWRACKPLSTSSVAATCPHHSTLLLDKNRRDAGKPRSQQAGPCQRRGAPWR